MVIDILCRSEVDGTTQDRIRELFKQLNADIEQRSLDEILHADNPVIFALCKIENHIVGFALLATYKTISGYRGMVEDVVVDKAHRRMGIGRRLMEKLLEEARNRDLDLVMLFTGHHREAAIGLYKSLGFTKRESGIYNLKISSTPSPLFHNH